VFDTTLLQASPFLELTAVLCVATLAGFVGLLLRQPVIVSFIAVGVLAGPSALGLVRPNAHIELLAELGIAVLLFLVGLKLDLALLRNQGVTALVSGLAQVGVTSVIGFGLARLLGFDPVNALYIAVALTFSSTIIIVKLLSDRKEIDSLHGRLALGFLIVQDLVVVLAMLVLSAYEVGSNATGTFDLWTRVAQAVASGLLLLILVAVFIRWIADRLVGRIAHSPDLLITFAIAWASLLAALGHQFGFSQELGGLLAGVSLASTPFREAIISRLSSVRDFLLLFFFVALGTEIEWQHMSQELGPALLFSLFVLVGNPIIVMVILGIMGFRKRTSFLAGLTVAQISEFSLVLMAMGRDLGHVSPEALGLVTLVGLISIAVSVYLITYGQHIYRVLEPWLGVFERRQVDRNATEDEPATGTKKPVDFILFGHGRYGRAIAAGLRRAGARLLVVDFNPEVVKVARSSGYRVVYGDAADQEFLKGLPLDGVRWVISTLPQHEMGVTHDDPRLILTKGLRLQRYQGSIAVSANHMEDVGALAAAGADLVLLPWQDAAVQAVNWLMGRDE
jgi:Kef-type K+ transport system membrane component KefB